MGSGSQARNEKKKRENGLISVNRLLQVNPYDTGSSHVSITHWPRLFGQTRKKQGLSVFHFIFSPLRKSQGFSQRETISLATSTAGDFLHLINDGLSPPRAQVSIEQIHGLGDSKSSRITVSGIRFEIDLGVSRQGSKSIWGFRFMVVNRHAGLIQGSFIGDSKSIWGFRVRVLNRFGDFVSSYCFVIMF